MARFTTPDAVKCVPAISTTSTALGPFTLARPPIGDTKVNASRSLACGEPSSRALWPVGREERTEFACHDRLFHRSNILARLLTPRA